MIFRNKRYIYKLYYYTEKGGVKFLTISLYKYLPYLYKEDSK